MPQLSLHLVKDEDDREQTRFLEVHFGEPENPNKLVFDVRSVGGTFNGVASLSSDYNQDSHVTILAALPSHLMSSQSEREELQITDDTQIPVLMRLIYAEGESRTPEELCQYYTELCSLLAPDSMTAKSMPDILLVPKLIMFRGVMEGEYPEYSRPLVITYAYVDVGDGELGIVDLLVFDPKISDTSLFEPVSLLPKAEDEQTVMPTYDYCVLTEQLASFVQDYYNRYRQPTTQSLNLLKQYGLVESKTTLKSFLEQMSGF